MELSIFDGLPSAPQRNVSFISLFYQFVFSVWIECIAFFSSPFRTDYTGPETEIAKLMREEEIHWIPTTKPEGYYSLEETAESQARLFMI